MTNDEIPNTLDAHFVIHLDRSEALAAENGLMERCKRNAMTLPVTDGLWVQFTYGCLRHQDGAFTGINIDSNEDIWWDGEPWSDMVIEFVPAVTNWQDSEVWPDMETY